MIKSITHTLIHGHDRTLDPLVTLVDHTDKLQATWELSDVVSGWQKLLALVNQSKSTTYGNVKKELRKLHGK